MARGPALHRPSRVNEPVEVAGAFDTCANRSPFLKSSPGSQGYHRRKTQRRVGRNRSHSHHFLHCKASASPSICQMPERRRRKWHNGRSQNLQCRCGQSSLGVFWAPRPAYRQQQYQTFRPRALLGAAPNCSRKHPTAACLCNPWPACRGLQLRASYSSAVDQYALRPLINDLAGKMTIALRLLPQEIRLHVARVGRWGHVQPLILRTALVRTATNSGRLCPRRSRAKSSPAVPVRGSILIPPAPPRQPKLRACIACTQFCRASISIAIGSSARPKPPWSAPRGGASGWIRSRRPTSGLSMVWPCEAGSRADQVSRRRATNHGPARNEPVRKQETRSSDARLDGRAALFVRLLRGQPLSALQGASTQNDRRNFRSRQFRCVSGP